MAVALFHLHQYSLITTVERNENYKNLSISFQTKYTHLAWLFCVLLTRVYLFFLTSTISVSSKYIYHFFHLPLHILVII